MYGSTPPPPGLCLVGIVVYNTTVQRFSMFPDDSRNNFSYATFQLRQSTAAILLSKQASLERDYVIIPVYSRYQSDLRSRLVGIHSEYSEIRIANQSNDYSNLFLVFLLRNEVRRTHPKAIIVAQVHDMGYAETQYYMQFYDVTTTSRNITWNCTASAVHGFSRSKQNTTCSSMTSQRRHGILHGIVLQVQCMGSVGRNKILHAVL